MKPWSETCMPKLDKILAAFLVMSFGVAFSDSQHFRLSFADSSWAGGRMNGIT